MNIKNQMLSVRLFIIVLVFIFSFISEGKVLSSENIEENADMTRATDVTITGEMNEYAKQSIIVDQISYPLCKKLKVFSPRNHLIPLKDIDAAEEVTLFMNKSCIRKIKVLRFAQ